MLSVQIGLSRSRLLLICSILQAKKKKKKKKSIKLIRKRLWGTVCGQDGISECAYHLITETEKLL